MKKRILFILVSFFLFIPFVNANSKEEVTFSKCVDGDTIKVLINGKEETVRFLAVDTPESVHPKKDLEYYGKEASNYTCTKVKEAKKIILEYDDNSTKRDKYDRILAWVYADDLFLQDSLVSEGYAEVAYLYGKYKYVDLLKDHQKVAEAKKIGIWNDEARNTFNEKNNIEEEKNLDDNSNLSFEDILILVVLLLLIFIFGGKKSLKKSVKKIFK